MPDASALPQPAEAVFDHAKFLENLVASFEAMFEIVDDHYIHHGQGATDEGVPFTVVAAGLQPENGTFIVVPLKTHKEACQMFERELEGFTLAWKVSNAGKDLSYLAWRDRPRFETAEGGLVLRARLAVGSAGDLKKETKDRIGQAG